MDKEQCSTCDAYKAVNEKSGYCRANPPQVLAFGMEQVQVRGIAKPGTTAMRPITGTRYPEMPADGWCRNGYRRAEQVKTAFDPAQLKPSGDATGLNGHNFKDE